MKLVMENLRTFTGNHEIDIPPITFLVGENSAGKTTLMNAISVVSNPTNFPIRPDFNQQPYEMGNFNNIVTQKKGRGGSPKDFSLGYRRSYGRGKNKELASVLATYDDRNGIPTPSKIDISYINSSFILLREGEEYKGTARLEGQHFSDFTIPLPDTRIIQRFHFNELLSSIIRSAVSLNDIKVESSFESYTKFLKVMPPNVFSLRKSISLAPIRSKPKRTYDDFKEDFTPEGGHIPFLMSRILNDDSLNKDFISVFQEYGNNSGLFDDIRIKRLGNSYLDPFQILVKKGTRESNIIDVGYGVSQVLPVVAECIAAGQGTRILMQQPEVHLHPRAQAALGNLISILHKNKKQHYVIETHSDYLIDRIRYEIMQGNIDYNSVGIIYLEKHKNATEVFEIKLDSNGNVIGAPDSYRDFFIREQFNLMGI